MFREPIVHLGTVSWVNINVGHYDNTDSSIFYDAQSAWSRCCRTCAKCLLEMSG